METIATIPERFNVDEYCFRSMELPKGSYTLGCHILSHFPAHRVIHNFKNYCGFYVIRGQGLFIDSARRRIPIVPGCFVQHIPESYHEIYRYENSGWIECSLSVDKKLFPELKKLDLVNPAKPVLNPGMHSNLISAFEELHHYIKHCSSGQLKRVYLKIQSILLDVVDLCEDHDVEVTEIDIMSTACDMLSLNLSEKLKLEQVARKLNMSYPHFRREFRRIIGVAPGEYRNRKRIEQATYILQQGDVPVKDVAYQMGYADPYIFSKQYKKITGMNPSNISKKPH